MLALSPDPFDASGGIALYLRDLLTAISTSEDCEEIVVVPRHGTADWGNLPPGIAGARRRGRGKISFVAAAFSTALARRSKIGIILCGHINFLGLALALRTLTGAPVMLVVYGIDAWSAHSRAAHRLARRADMVISISEVTRTRFAAWSAVDEDRVAVIPNAIHLEWYGPGPRKRALVERYGLEGKRVLMTLGRMHPAERYKGFDEVLELLPSLARSYPDIVYVAAGDGADRPRLEARAQELGVRDRVVFTGYVPEEEKADHLRLADVYVMPSTGEGFGFVFLEAMACGIPVVASRADGGRDAVRDGMLGALVDPNAPAEIVRAIATALAVPRGIVPEGLDYFAYARFERRVHEVVAGALARA